MLWRDGVPVQPGKTILRAAGSSARIASAGGRSRRQAAASVALAELMEVTRGQAPAANFIDTRPAHAFVEVQVVRWMQEGAA
jgi:hypothetical protein